MTQAKKQELSTPSTGQVDKFKAMAKELEADGDQAAFDKALKHLSKASVHVTKQK